MPSSTSSPETPEERLARVRAQARETPVQRLARVRAASDMAARDNLSPNNRTPSTVDAGRRQVARAAFESPNVPYSPSPSPLEPGKDTGAIQRVLSGPQRPYERMTPGKRQLAADLTENALRGIPGGVLNAATSTIRLPEQVVRAGIRAIKNVNNVVWVKADSPMGWFLGYTVDGPLPGNHPILSMLVGGVPETPVTDRALPVLGAAEQGVQRLLQPEGFGGVIGANIGMLGAFSAAPKLLGVPAEARVVPIEKPFGQLTSDLAKTHEARGAPISPEVAPSTPEGEIAFPEPTAAERASVPSRPGLGGLADRLQAPEAPEPTIPPRMTDTEFARYQRETRQMEDRLTQQFADITAQATPATPETPVQRLERVRSGFVNRERIPAIEQLAQERHAARVAELERIDAERVAQPAPRMTDPEFARHQRETRQMEERLTRQFADITTAAKPATEPATPAPSAPPPTSDTPKFGGKYPWEMTRDEFMAEATRQFEARPPIRTGKKGEVIRHKVDAETLQTFANGRRVLVANAIREGKPVPPEVLADYPDLAAGDRRVNQGFGREAQDPETLTLYRRRAGESDAAPPPVGGPPKPLTRPDTGQPRVKVGDLSGVKATGYYQPASGRIELDAATLKGMTREQRASLVRHEIAHKVEFEHEIWMKSDTELWDMWKKNPDQPLFQWWEDLGHRRQFNNDVSPEIIANLYADRFEQGTVNHFDAEGRAVTSPIPKPIMDILREIDDKVGIYKKRAVRGQSAPPPVGGPPAAPEAGFSTLPVLGGLAGAGGGALIGAQDKEHPLRGAIIGGVLGGIAGAFGTTKLEEHGPALRDSFRKIIAPSERTPEAQMTGRIIAAHAALAAQDFERAAYALENLRKVVKPLTTTEGRDFVANIEAGTPTNLPPELRAPVAAIRQALDSERDAIIGLGKGALEHFNENYFPHIWKDPKAAADAFVLASGTRPLMGGKSFLKQRSIPTIEDGLKLKLVPEMDHPVDLVLLKLMEMRRFRMGHEIVAEMKTSKIIHYVKVGGDIPAGEVKINDPFATVYAPRGTAPYGATIAGHYYAPEPVATVLNNYLSPGLRGNILFRGVMSFGNILNQAQLGISAFHLGFTSLDAIVSKTALGLEQLAAGRPLDALASAAAAPAAPLTNFFQGRRLRRALLVPGSEGAEFAKIAEAYISGGGRLSMSKVYKNNSIEKFMQAVRRKEIGAAAFQAIPAALEAASKPLMEWIVPAQKMGVAADLIRFELSRLPAGATLDDARAVMRKVTESVDNRMGQMVYDNLFWNKVVKDMAMVSVRSVGWNLGTIRELGGGVKDLVTAPARIARVIKGTSPITERILTHRMAYVAALPVTVGLMGAVANYLYTGEAPKELKDYFFPRNGRTDDMGNPERVSLPSYIKDVYAYSSHPVRTVQNKLHPMLAIVSDMLHNEDYFGDQIRNVDDPVMQKIIQETEFFLKEVMPFGIQNIKEERRRTGHISVAPLFGLTPASRELVRTPAQNTMSRLNSAGAGGLTPEQREISQARADVYRQVERGAMDEGTALKQLVGTGMKPGDAISQLKQHRQEQMVQSFKRLSLPNAEKVFAQGMPWEQVIWKPVLDKKRYDDARARSIPAPTGVTYSIPQ